MSKPLITLIKEGPSCLGYDAEIHTNVFERVLTELVREPYNINSSHITSHSLGVSKVEKSTTLTLNINKTFYLKFKVAPHKWFGQGAYSNTEFEGFRFEACCSLRKEVLDLYELEDMVSVDKAGQPYMSGEWNFVSLMDLPAIGLIEVTLGNLIQSNLDESI